MYDHAGGLALSGRTLIVPFERRKGTVAAGFRVVGLEDPTAPKWGPLVPRMAGQRANAGAAALTQLADGRFVALVFGYDSSDVEVFITEPGAEDPVAAVWRSRATARTPFVGHYQGVQLITRCDGALFALGTYENTAREDWADLWRVDFVDAAWTPRFTAVAKRRFDSGDFDAGAGAYVDGEGRLGIDAVEHLDGDEPGGATVRVSELR
jgi:hypothetical protein